MLTFTQTFMIVFVSIIILVGIFIFLFTRHLKNHPASGTIIGKTKKEKFFVLIVEDKKQRRINITTDEATWSKAQWGDPYTAQKTDWYLMSEY